MDGDRILVELTIHRRFRGMSPMGSRLVVGLREFFRLGIVILAGALAFPVLGPGPGSALILALLWVVASGWFAREQPGTVRVILTDDGIHYVEKGFFCAWDEVDTHEVVGESMIFEPAAGVVPPPLFGRRRLRIPLAPATRERTLELFRTHTVRNEGGPS
jgi:hypothetical protein